MTFYLQDVTAGKPGNTLATVTAHETVLPRLPANTNALISTNAGLTWVFSAPGASLLEIHVLQPDGPLLGRFNKSSGTATAGSWVRDGMRFFLQDVAGGKPLSYANTLASGVAVVDAAVSGHDNVVFGPTPAVVLDTEGTGLGSSSLYWHAPGSSKVEIHVVAPDGPLYAQTGNTGFGSMDGWVTDGMQFFLQDASSGDPTSTANTLAVTTVAVQSPLQHYIAIIGNSGNPEVFSRESGQILNIVQLPPGVTGLDMHTGPDGSLLYVLGRDGNFYVIDPAALQIQSTLPTSTAIGGSAAGVNSFTWIKGPQAKDLILTGVGSGLVAGAIADLYAVDPELGSVVGTIPCNCKGGAPVYNPYNQSSYMHQGGIEARALPVTTSLPVITANLQLGPSLQVSRPPDAPLGYADYDYSVTPFIMSGGTQGQILIAWQDGYFYPQGVGWFDQTALIDAASNLQKDLPLPAPPGGTWLPLIVSPDRKSFFAQVQTFLIPDPSSPFFAIQLGLIERFQVNQYPDGSVVAVGDAGINQPDASHVVQGPVAFDDKYAYLTWQAATVNPAGYTPRGNVFLYRLDPNTLQPIGSANWIDTLIQPPSGLGGVTGVSVGTYAFKAQ